MSKPVETTTAAGSAVGEGEGATATKVVSSLSKKMSAPGGLSVADIERRSRERLMAHQADAMKAIASAISELEQLVLEGGGRYDPEYYHVASRMLNVAGFFDTGPLYDAGYSLCEIIDVMQTRDRWSIEPVKVHIRALRLIHTDNLKVSPQSASLMQGLKALLEHARNS